ncbi:hypothetical protein AMTRI_Chr04g183590 [Amborella trichopoda]
MESNPSKSPSPTPLHVYQHNNTPEYFSQRKSIRENFSQSYNNLLPNLSTKMAPKTNQLLKNQPWKINFTQTKSMREDFYEKKGIRERNLRSQQKPTKKLTDLALKSSFVFN